MNLEARAHAVTAIDDCERIMSKHCYYYSAGLHRESFYRLWSEREDITFTTKQGQIQGRHNIFKSYVLDQENAAFEHYMKLKEIYPEISCVNDYRRLLSFKKPLMGNMVLEVADDGLSAKGLWYNMGCEYTTLTLEKQKKALWTLLRHAADFVYEDGEWRILNLRIAVDAEGKMDLFQWALNQAPVDLQDAPESLTVKKVTHQTYSPTQIPQNSPRIPEPYKTFAATESYAKI